MVDAFLQRQSRYFLEEELRETLLREAQVKTVPAGSLLVGEGSYLKVIPIVLQGLVKVYRSEEGKEALLYYIRPVESCIMSVAATFSNEKAAFKAVAEEESQLLLIPARVVPHWQAAFPSFNLFITDLYKQRFEELLHAFNEVAFRRSDERLLHYLQDKAQALRSAEVPLTHQQIADELGIARETVSRLLKRLEQEGVVKLRRGVIMISKK